MTPDLTLDYMSAVRKRCGDDVHLWLYTNGTLLTADLCSRLRDAGLDEIRFDLGAVRYHLKKLRLAVGCIPTVTVEIPAVPEDEELLKRKMVEMAGAGVNHLNLHQIRLTPYNLGPLTARGYTFLHGEKVTVLESELSALRTVRFGLEHGTHGRPPRLSVQRVRCGSAPPCRAHTAAAPRPAPRPARLQARGAPAPARRAR